jgi:hypothetical protein
MQHEPFRVTRIFDLFSTSNGLNHKGYAGTFTLARQGTHTRYLVALERGIAAAHGQEGDDGVGARLQSFVRMSDETSLEAAGLCFSRFVERGRPIQACDQTRRSIAAFCFGEILEISEIQQDGIGARVDKSLDLNFRVERTRYWS